MQNGKIEGVTFVESWIVENPSNDKSITLVLVILKVVGLNYESR